MFQSNVEDAIHQLLKKLLATDDPVEFDSLSSQLKSTLHDRIERLRQQAQGLKDATRSSERRRKSRNGGNKP